MRVTAVRFGTAAALLATLVGCPSPMAPGEIPGSAISRLPGSEAVWEPRGFPILLSNELKTKYAPGDIAVDASGNAYFATKKGLERLTPQGAVSTLCALPNYGMAGCLTLAADGAILIYDGDEKIVRVQANGTSEVVVEDRSLRRYGVRHMRVDKAGRIFTHSGGGSFLEFEPDGTFVEPPAASPSPAPSTSPSASSSPTPSSPTPSSPPSARPTTRPPWDPSGLFGDVEVPKNPPIEGMEVTSDGHVLRIDREGKVYDRGPDGKVKTYELAIPAQAVPAVGVEIGALLFRPAPKDQLVLVRPRREVGQASFLGIPIGEKRRRVGEELLWFDRKGKLLRQAYLAGQEINDVAVFDAKGRFYFEGDWVINAVLP